MVEGTPLLRVQAGNRLEGSNPFHSATYPRESVLPIRLRPEFSVVFGVVGPSLGIGLSLRSLRRAPEADVSSRRYPLSFRK